MELSTEDSAAMEKTQTLEEAREKREREKSTAKAEAESKYGSPSAEHRLNEVAEKEKWASQITPVLEEDDEKARKGRTFL